MTSKRERKTNYIKEFIECKRCYFDQQNIKCKYQHTCTKDLATRKIVDIHPKSKMK